MDSTIHLIERFQQEGDLEALNVLLARYLPLIEEIVDQYQQSELSREVILEKACERFGFLMGKYQLSVQMPIEVFLTNTYRMFLRSL